MSLSKEPNMREWLESLRAQQSETMSTSNHLPSHAQLTAWLLDVQNENDRLKTQIGHDEKIITAQAERILSLHAMHDHMKAQIVEKDKIILNLNEQIAIRKDQIRNREEWFNELDDEKKKLQAQYDAQVSEIKKLKKTIDTQKSLKDYHYLEQTIDNLNRDLNSRIKGLETELEQVSKNGIDLFTDRQVVREERDKLQNELAKLKRTNEALRGDLLGVAPQIAKLRLDRDKLSGRVGALQHSNNELGRKYQITMNRYNKLLERVKTMEMATKLKVPSLGDAPGEMRPMIVQPAEPSSEPMIVQPAEPSATYVLLTEWVEQLGQTVSMLQFNLEHQTNVQKAKEKELAELRKTVYELQKATNGIEYEYMEPARSGKDFVTYFAFEARSPKDTPTGRRRISF